METKLVTGNFLLYAGVSKSSRTGSNRIYAYNNKHSLRSNTEGYNGKTH